MTQEKGRNPTAWIVCNGSSGDHHSLELVNPCPPSSEGPALTLLPPTANNLGAIRLKTDTAVMVRLAKLASVHGDLLRKQLFIKRMGDAKNVYLDAIS